MKHIFKRGEFYWYRRRVPKEAARLDKRKDVRISLKTKDYKNAIIKADIYNKYMDEFWGALIKSGTAHGLEEKYEAAVELAKAQGFIYVTNDRLAEGPLERIIERLIKPIETEETATALLGGVDQPKILLSAALEKFWEISVDKLSGKTKDQIRKWRNPRKRAVSEFITLRGDKAIQDINREDMLQLRSWWGDRIEAGYDSDSANKSMRYVRDVALDVGKLYQLDIDKSIFIDLRYSVTENQRPPFESDYVESIFLNRLEGMNEDARSAVEILAETGARPVEIIGLGKKDIILNPIESELSTSKAGNDIPHIWIRGNEKTGHLKTKTSERKIPLVGRALKAAQKYPEGFDRWSNPDSFTAAIGKYLRDNNLLPTPDHSLYSLRHTFKDRLRDAEAPEEIIDELMGHKKDGPKYGRGYLLEKKQKWLLTIAYKNNDLTI